MNNETWRLECTLHDSLPKSEALLLFKSSILNSDSILRVSYLPKECFSLLIQSKDQRGSSRWLYIRPPARTRKTGKQLTVWQERRLDSRERDERGAQKLEEKKRKSLEVVVEALLNKEKYQYLSPRCHFCLDRGLNRLTRILARGAFNLSSQAAKRHDLIVFFV